MSAHFIEIDIILKSNSKAWVIDKSKPNIPIIKIENYDFNLFKSGIFKSHGNKISFNGKVFWLSNDFMNKLKIKSKNHNSDLSNLAISMQEFLNPEITEDIEYDIDLSIFTPIINTNDDIYIICSKNTKNNFKNQILKFEDKLSELGLRVEKYYYLSETFYNRNDDNIAYLKSKLLLQHLIGLKSNNDEITSEEIKSYEQITFYDDNINSIKTSKGINKLLEKLIVNTEDGIKLLIKNRIKENDILLIIKEFTHNKANKFKEYNIQLEYSNIIKNFESYKYNSNL